jgi:outer membrane lipoprotein-sorting protein
MFPTRTAAAICAGLFIACTTAVPAKTPAPLTAFAKTWDSMSGYKTAIHCFSAKDGKTENSQFNYTFTKPSSISMSIVSGPRAGNTVKWSGGETVTAGKGMFTKKFALTDSAVTSLRGGTIVDLSFGAILKHAEGLQGKKSSASTTMDGEPANVVTVNVAQPSSDDGLTREVLYLSGSTDLPLRVDGYVESQLVTSCTFSDTTKT